MKHKNEAPEIIVGVPVHNGGEHLERCLSSLAQQTFPSFRVIIFENMSTDKSLKIAEKFCNSDDRFSILKSQKLLPMLENFYRAINHCANHAPFFCLRAHDDYSDPNYLEALHSSLKNNPEKTIAVPRVVQIKTDGSLKTVEVNELMQDTRAFIKAAKKGEYWKFPGSWYYGLYRGVKAAETLISAHKHFNSPWSSDRYAILNFLLRDELIINHGTKFYCQLGSNSKSYMEKTVMARLKFRAKYFQSVMKLLKDGGMTKGPLGVKAYILGWRTAKRHTCYFGRKLFITY